MFKCWSNENHKEPVHTSFEGITKQMTMHLHIINIHLSGGFRCYCEMKIYLFSCSVGFVYHSTFFEAPTFQPASMFLS